MDIGHVLLRIHNKGTHLQPPAGIDVRPPKDGIHPQMQFHQVNRLHQIVVHPGIESPLLGEEVILGSHQDNGNVLVLLPNILHQPVAVHIRHHDVGNDQVIAVPVHQVKGLFSVIASINLKALLLQKHADGLLQRLVVLLRIEIKPDREREASLKLPFPIRKKVFSIGKKRA